MARSSIKSKATQSKQGLGCLVAFFALFGAAGALAAYFTFLRPLMLIETAKQWVPVPCVINSSEVGSHSDKDGTTYSIDIQYQFEMDGTTYQGDRYDFRSGSSSGYDGKREIVDQYPAGAVTTCYVDPHNPQNSVINRNPGDYLWWGLLSLPFVVIGFGGIFFAFRKPRDLPASLAKAGGARNQASNRQLSSEPQSTVLKPANTPLGKLFGGLIFALFWNGIIAVPIFGEVIPGFRSGNPEWSLSLFMIPFALVGLGAFAFVVYQVLALRNPRVTLTLSSADICLGDIITLSWVMRGEANRIKNFKIRLEARESATYRRGTSTYTDHHVFFEQEIFASVQPRQFARGGVDFILPSESYPSFKSDNNKIEWRLLVHGDIPRWPDMNDEYPLQILPSRESAS